MRPLASPVHDHRLLGRVEAAIGLLFVIIASALNPIDAIFGLVFVAPVMAGVLYLTVFRRVARQAVADPPPAPTVEREEPGEFGRRIAWPVAAQVAVYLIFTATARAPGLLGGIALGIGVGLILTARWLERWENAHDVGLLREPGSRARAGQAGASRGYYVAPGGKTNVPGVANRT